MSDLICFACLYDPPIEGGPTPAILVAGGASLCEGHLHLARHDNITSTDVIRLKSEWSIGDDEE